ncbi:MAG: proton-conducting membrane transporter [Mesorhizobium sp.]|uniref:proton-conducting membrane transporter n=1 Tax=Mesorhizobium sp. TaxID=1871066 RepID=UPI0012205EE8|nr:proton-conducting membrane transporter [Mesorhizobium sp.]TIT20020.1 MAG: proton-conducting membrane transporter [Mesorhizobium sp.]
MGTFFYMLLAFLVGVLVGWFIWGRLRGELDSLRGDLDRTRSERDRLRADSNRLTGELDACGRARADLERRLGEAPAAKAPTAATAKAPAAKTGATKAAMQAPSTLMSTSAPAKPAPKKSATAKAATAPRASAAKTATPNPPASKASAAPRTAPAASKASPAASKAAPAAKKAATGNSTTAAAGKANDLRRLIGIGPTNERLLKGLGVTTYAQIAAWTPDDVRRIEATLNFDGRIERERWIEQAKLLATGDEKEFARRFPTAGEASNT